MRFMDFQIKFYQCWLLLSNYLISGFHIAPWLGGKMSEQNILHWDLLTPCGWTQTLQHLACFTKNTRKDLCKEGILILYTNMLINHLK